MSDDDLRLTLDISVGASPVRGVLTGPHGQPTRFVGWLELMSALDAATSPAAPESGGPQKPWGRP